MTLTSAEAAKMQKHNADLVRENETLTRDNAELRRHVEAIKQAALKYQKSSTRIVCVTCAFRELDGGEEPCVSCGPHMNAGNWTPPDA